MLTPFSFAQRGADFDKEVLAVAGEELDKVRTTMVSTENTQRFNHGRKWVTKPGYGGDESGEMEEHGFGFETRFEDIVAHKLAIIPQFRLDLSEAMERQFRQSMYQTIERSTNASGNVVNMNDQNSIAEAFLEVLRKIEFAVDANGNVSLPEIHLHPEAAKKLFASVEAQTPEFHVELERVKAEKTQKALEWERDRLAKFASSGNER